MINCEIGDLCNHGNSVFKRCCEHSYCFKIYLIYVPHNSCIGNLCKEKLDILFMKTKFLCIIQCDLK